MDGIYAALAIIPFLGLIGFVIWFHFYRSNLLLQQWADEHGFRIVEQKYRSFFKGPFFWTSSRGQTVYSVVVADRHGRLRRGWARCGGWWLGLLSNKVEVRWED